jgi:hypothetical protein
VGECSLGVEEIASAQGGNQKTISIFFKECLSGKSIILDAGGSGAILFHESIVSLSEVSSLPLMG